jgi:hypothetical protein
MGSETRGPSSGTGSFADAWKVRATYGRPAAVIRIEKSAPTRITPRSQVTIPIELRQKFGLLPGTEVEF